MNHTPQLTLLLEDGTALTGESFGADTETAGEVVFNTGMVGYPESFTDPSYTGQILVLTYPLIGNYGVPSSHAAQRRGSPKPVALAEGLPLSSTSLNLSLPQSKNPSIPLHFESDRIRISGAVVSDYSKNFNHWQAKQSLGDWLTSQNIPAITSIDTRTLTQKIRTKGAMLGVLTKHPEQFFDSRGKIILEKFYDPNKENLVAKVSIKKPITYHADQTRSEAKCPILNFLSSPHPLLKNPVTRPKHIILVDCGMKLNILRSFLKRGINVTRVPWNYNPWKNPIMKGGKALAMRSCPDGIFFSNGPGDPARLPEIVETMKEAFRRKIPTFGICLGLQIMGLAAGGTTFKLKFGHRSQNQPCIDLETGRCYITSQNHGYAVDAKSLKGDWKVWLQNANDGTVEGIKHKTLPFSSVQFHPESTPGPTDTIGLFDQFISQL